MNRRHIILANRDLVDRLTREEGRRRNLPHAALAQLEMYVFNRLLEEGVAGLQDWRLALHRSPEDALGAVLRPVVCSRISDYISVRARPRPVFSVHRQLDELGRKRIPRKGANRAAAVVKPPGHLLLAAAEWVYSPRTHTEVFRPIIADLRLEYGEALVAGRRRKASWVRWRYYAAFWAAAAARLPISAARTIALLWKLSGPAGG
jgi:hypothetical protein